MIERISKWIVVLVLSLVSVFPIFWIFLTSIKTDAEVVNIPPSWFFQPTFDHYYSIIFHGGGAEVAYAFELWSSFLNSIVVSLGTTALAVAIGFPAAYSISRFNTGGRPLLSWILSFRMLPPIVFLIPMFILYQLYGLMDTQIGLVLIYLTFNVPLAVFILKGFLDDMPRDYEEAGMVDGCSRIQSLWKIALPMSGPGIVAVSIIIFLFSFNEFMFAYVLTTRNAVTLTAKAAVFITEYTFLWADLAAAMILMIVPMMVATILLQGQIIKGLRTGLKA